MSASPGISIPQRADHLAIAAELEQIVPIRGENVTFRWLYTMDISCSSEGECSTLDIDRVYAADAQGRFAESLGPRAAGGTAGVVHTIPGSDAVLYAPGYKAWDFLLLPDPDDPARRHWTLKLAFARLPRPMSR